MLSKETKTLQKTLANYCRTGVTIPIQGARQDRLHNYRRLVFNIFEDALRSAYPITCDILGEEKWKDLVDEFVAKSSPKSPEFWKMPYDLYEFVIKEEYGNKIEMPYLSDLLLFEWVEIQVHSMPDKEEVKIITWHNESKFKLNLHFEILNLNYPVFKFKADENIDKRADYSLLIYRVENSGQVKFIEISNFLAVLFTQLSNGLNLEEALKPVLDMFKVPFSTDMLPQLDKFIDLLVKENLAEPV